MTTCADVQIGVSRHISRNAFWQCGHHHKGWRTRQIYAQVPKVCAAVLQVGLSLQHDRFYHINIISLCTSPSGADCHADARPTRQNTNIHKRAREA